MTDSTNMYLDTRNLAEHGFTFTEAVIEGLAPGGGLFVPENIPAMTVEEICALTELPYAQRAASVFKRFGIDLPDAEIDRLMELSYGDNFDDERICPITEVGKGLHVLELWHGPTSAFKDMALQCMPNFFSASVEALRERGGSKEDYLILVATSGDTGKAALAGLDRKSVV